ncbi:MAG: pyruvate kinase [Anaerolineales bacterium]|nr:pyruvate kinase [Anaerolineales bacterium]
MKRRSKIIATIGPVSSSIERLRQLVEAGMDVARLNFSHGDHPDHAKVVKRLRQVSQEAGRAIAILQDLSGPKLRTGRLKNDEPVSLLEGVRIKLTPQPVEGTHERLSVDYDRLVEDVKPGERILLDDGRLELRVIGSTDEELEAEVTVGGLLGSNKGINIPGVKLSTTPLTQKDLRDLAFGMEQGVDAVALSYVRRAEDLHALHDAISACCPGNERIPIIAKLERHEAVERLDSILEACDGVMVARGDLGVEVSPEKVPSIQKHIIRRANVNLRMVITATQMLETMMVHSRPTRAEASDVANAVFDGSDALMLSGETAVGNYPIEAVKTMNRIILDAEDHAAEWGYEAWDNTTPTEDDAVATSHAVRMLAHDRAVAAIAVFTRSGRTASLISKVRPNVPILAFTPEALTYQRMALLWGVIPFLVPMSNSVEEMIAHVRDACLSSGIVKHGEQAILVASLPIGAMGPPNFILLHRVE